MGFESFLTDAGIRMNSSLDKADAFPDQELICLMEAAVIGCNALKDLVKNVDFRTTLEDVDRLRKENTPEFRKTLEDLEAFDDFLSVELKVLIRGGFPEFLANQIVGWCRDVRREVLRRARTPSEIISDAERLRDHACKMSQELQGRVQEEREKKKTADALKKTAKGIAGFALIGLNAAAGIAAGVTTAVPTAGTSMLLAGAGVATSAALGAGIANNATSQDAASNNRAASASG